MTPTEAQHSLGSERASADAAPAVFGSGDYERLRARLARAVARTCPASLADRRDDLVQNALLRVVALQQRSAGERTFSASYLYRAAHSALVDELRRVRRRREVPLEDQSAAGPATGTAPGPDPEHATHGRQIGRGLLACLQELPEQRRLAVTLHLQGHSVPEAARLLDWGTKRTENLVYRGLAALRACLAAKGLTP
jgi:RNA polymerase sigma-70 factor (ECF subfamily)